MVREMGRSPGQEKVGRAIKGKVPGEGARADDKARETDSSEWARITESESRFGIWAG